MRLLSGAGRDLHRRLFMQLRLFLKIPLIYVFAGLGGGDLSRQIYEEKDVAVWIRTYATHAQCAGISLCCTPLHTRREAHYFVKCAINAPPVEHYCVADEFYESQESEQIGQLCKTYQFSRNKIRDFGSFCLHITIKIIFLTILCRCAQPQIWIKNS